MAYSKRDLAGLKGQTFDIVIIGGGITGAWLACHCAQQGYSTALIEKHDYASQTSSASSKTLHGGIRYLQQFQFDKVRESAMERAHYLYAAPHLSRPVPFVLPTYKNFQRSKFFLMCGMLAYRILCLGENRLIASREQELPPVRTLSRSQLNDICDLTHEDHTGAVVFYERHMRDSERMVLAILQTARQLGAQIHNYVSASDFQMDNGSVTGVIAKDEQSGDEFKIDARLVVNAAGPWIDSLNAHLPKADSAPSINGFAVGSHIITRQLCGHAVGITTKHQSDAKVDRGGRHMFIIPWRGYSLIGTSYDEIDSPNGKIDIESDHVEQILEAVNQGIPSANLTREELVSGYSGLYPLHTDNIQSTVYQGSGEYQIIDHANANELEGLVTALGAKFTTGRKISELTMRVVNKKLAQEGESNHHGVSKLKLASSKYASLSEFTKAKQAEYKARFDSLTIDHLISCYGSDIDEFIKSLVDSESYEKIIAHQADILGQVAWAVRYEQALSLEDFVYRRSSLGLLGLTSLSIEKIASVMAIELDWSEDEKNRQISDLNASLLTVKTALLGADQLAG